LINKYRKTCYSDIFTAASIAHYQCNILDYVEDIIFHKDSKKLCDGELFLSTQQEDVLLSIQEEKKTSVKSGKGCGKAQPVDLEIDTPTGRRRFGDLTVGDRVFGKNGKPTTITGVFPQGVKDVYRVVFADETSTECCKEHLWAVKGRQERRLHNNYVVKSLEEMMNTGIRVGGKLRFRQWEIPKNGPVEFDSNDNLPIHPYTLGVWLGDGTRSKGEITSADTDLIERLREIGETVTVCSYDDIQYKVLNLYKKLKDVGIDQCYSFQKFVPDNYKYNSIAVREEVLRGLLDTDGSARIGGSSIEFTSTSKKLAEDVAWLSRSLGHKVQKISQKTGSYIHKISKKKIICRESYRISITPVDDSKMFYIGRKQKRLKFGLQERYLKKNIDRVEHIGSKECVCISVDAEDCLYLTSDFIVTHNTGSIAMATNWFMSVNPQHTKIICTAPSFGTLSSALWPEISLWTNRSLVKDLFTITEEKMYLNEKPKECFCEPRTAKDKESMQGIHAPNLLIICDEASGIADDILHTLDSTLTSGKNNKIIMISNPTRTIGFFFDSHKFNSTWNKLTLNAEDSPFVDQEKVQSVLDQFGRDHTIYKVDVLGEFPEGNVDSFISLADVEDAMNRDIIPSGKIEIGVDVARFGNDQTVIYWRHGLKVYEPATLIKSSIPDTSRAVLELVQTIRYKTNYTERIRVKVDDSGVGGGVTDVLGEDRENNIEVVPVNFGAKGDDRYHNEVSKMWGNLRDHIKLISIPKHDRLRQELSARRWKLSQTGKITIEGKQDFKKGFGFSPDFADALILCFAEKGVERTVLREFDPLDKSVIRDNLNYIGEDRYCCMYYSKDLFSSIVYSSWDGNRVYIFDECVGDDSIIGVATNVMGHQPIKRIIGNDRMFTRDGDCLEQRFRKFKVNVFENMSYNEVASIETLNMMMAQKRIIISSKCRKTIEQLYKWKMSSKQVNQDVEFGLCYALCHLMAELKRKIEHRAPSTVIPAYTGEQERVLASISSDENNNNWMMY